MAKKTKHNPDEATLDLGLDEMDADFKQETGPVTVLGMTFSNDEERRAYFCEQLRAKLPELRNIEGFPIGSDDDIVDLSDPPYYTACPNPWLNDFIAEWEQEKLQLEAEGKRHPNVVVNEPYAADVSEGKNNPIYTAHTYHTKVPHPAIMRYILNYTQPGDIVLDGFAGTGMTGVAATLCGSNNAVSSLNCKDVNIGIRHHICSDLSPYASLIDYNYNTPFNLSKVNRDLDYVVNGLIANCEWMFQTRHSNGEIGIIECVVWSECFRCPNCGEDITFWDVAVDHDNKCIKDEFNCPSCNQMLTKKTVDLLKDTIYDPILKEIREQVRYLPRLIVYKYKGKRYQKFADADDLELVSKIFEISKAYKAPINRMIDGGETRRNDKKGFTHTLDFYTRRNLIALCELNRLIETSSSAKKLRFLFTGILSRVSRMNRLGGRYYFFGGGGWNLTGLSGTLYIPSLSVETSVLSVLNSRKNVFSLLSEFAPSDYEGLQMTGSACSLPLQDNSVDYIFTDPPFGANIAYSELNSIPEAWLNIFTNISTEAIINPNQNKTLFDYQNLMNSSIREFYRVLKPGKWLTMEFSNTAASVWNSIQTALQNAGFVVVNVAALDKKQGSFKAVTTTTAVKQDLIISCFKPTEQLLYKFENEAPGTSVWDFIDELLSRLPVHLEHSNKTTAVVERSPKILYDRLISFYVQHSFPVPLNAQEFQAGLRERYAERDGMYFVPSQAAKYDELRKRTDGFQASLFFVDSEQGGIAWLNNELSTPQTYQDLQPKWMQAINGVRKGDVLPELIQILEENFIKESDGKWRKPNLQDDVDLAALRHKALMREFKVYVEVAQKPRGKIKEARIEALRAGFKQCYQDKNFATIVAVGDRIPQNLLTEDEQLLQFYEIASSRV